MSPTKYLLLPCLVLASLYVYSHARELTHLEDWVASEDGELGSSNDVEPLDVSSEKDSDHFKCKRHQEGKHHPCHHPPKGAPTPTAIEIDSNEDLDSVDDEIEDVDDDIAPNGEKSDDKKHHHKHKKHHPCNNKRDEDKDDHKKKSGHHKCKHHPCHRHSHPPKGMPTYGPVQPPAAESFFVLDGADDPMQLYEVDSVDEEPIETNENLDSDHEKSRHKCKHNHHRKHRHGHGHAHAHAPAPSPIPTSFGLPAPAPSPEPSFEVETVDLY